MSFFEIVYRIGNSRKKIVLEAQTKLDAMKQFQSMQIGVLVNIKERNEPLNIKIQKIQDKFKDPIKNKRVETENYISVLDQLSIMLDAGMPLNTCLSEVVSSTEDPMLKAIFEEIRTDIEEGQSLSNAFKPYKNQLGNLSVSMVSLGEQTGTLGESITKLSEIIQNIHDNRAKLKKATRYPLFTIGAMAIAFTIVIIFVIPQFEDMFTQMQAELPFPTLMLLWIENAIVTYGPIILIAAAILAIAYSKLYKTNEKIEYNTDKYMLKVYIVGIVTKYAMIGRFVYIFNILVKAGIPIVDALNAAIEIIENKYIRSQFEKVKEAIEEGRSLYNGFQDSGMFSSMILQMLKAGEDSGGLNKMLDKITIYYSKKYNNIIDNVSSMIEPILIGAIAGFVLLLALGIFLPMWSMADTMM
jgi:general secretion pathway protein F